MKHAQYSKKSLEDLGNIADYTAKMWGAKQAKVYLKDIRDKIHQIATGDAIVQVLHIPRPAILKVRVNRHLIIFESTDATVRIIRILYDLMDIPQHLTKN
jgi:plasmid stabilization system protein ParE